MQIKGLLQKSMATINKHRLKLKARKYYQQYHKALSILSCGKNLGENISSAASEAKQNFNATLDELAKIDPETPIKRL